MPPSPFLQGSPLCRAPHPCAVGLPQPPHTPTPSHADFTPAAIFSSHQIPPPRARRGVSSPSRPLISCIICAPIIHALAAVGAAPPGRGGLIPPPSSSSRSHLHPSFPPSSPTAPPGRTTASWLCLHFGFNLPQGFLNLIREGGAAFKGAGLTFAAATRAAWRKKIGCGERGGASERAAVVLQSLNNAGS